MTYNIYIEQQVKDFLDNLDEKSQNNLDKLDINMSVDTHIIQITNKVFRTTYTNSENNKEKIRKLWEEICEDIHVLPIELDELLWFINKDLNELCETILNRKTQR